MIEAAMIAAYAAGAISWGMGVLGIVAPRKALKLVGLQLDPAAPEALSEVRATFGGLFLAMSLLAIVSGDTMAFAAAGAAWLGAGVIRVVSILADGIATGKNWGAALFESGLGLGMLAPFLAGAV